MKMTGQLQSQLRDFAILFIAFILSISSVTALGVSSSYWGGHPLYVTPGETKEIALQLQNMDSDAGDLSVSVKLTAGTEIAKLKYVGKVYNMPYGTDDTPVAIIITIPKDAQPGQKWTITSMVVGSPLVKGEGVVQLNTGMQQSFEVIVQQPEEAAAKEAPTLWKNRDFSIIAISISVVLLGIIIFFLVKKRNPS
ncbi:hypothetical protein HZA98_00020 [Candidatus Woesearchaeota archaeon]|nr:hypothetical protein [Candidatus Woesearchaeota archaeon]